MKCASTALMWTKRLLQLFPSCHGVLWCVYFGVYGLCVWCVVFFFFFLVVVGEEVHLQYKKSYPHLLNYFAVHFPIIFSAMSPSPISKARKSGGSAAE